LKLLFENWRGYQDQLFIEKEIEDLKSWLIAEGYYTKEELLMLKEGALSSAWNWVKGKLQDAKEWTYEQYVKFVKPLLAKLKGFILNLKKKGFLKKYRARMEMHAIDLFSTKKYIKLGAVFLSGMVGAILNQVMNIPEKIEALGNVLSLIKDGKWAAAAEAIGLPFDDIKALVGGLQNFGKDMDKTYGIGPDKVGQGEFELAEEQEDDIDLVSKVVIKDKDKILILKRAKDMDFGPEKWDLPGGHRRRKLANTRRKVCRNL